MSTINLPPSPRFLAGTSNGYPLTGRRYRATDGQHYMVDARGALRRCDDSGRLTPRQRIKQRPKRHQLAS